MEKNKYERMSKIEKKELIKKYKKSDSGASLFMRVTRLKITGFLGLIFTLILLIIEYKTIEVKDFLIIIPLVLASILFIIMSCKIKKKILNDFALKNL